MDITNTIRLYAECISGGAITEPQGGTWMSAICIWQGSTEPLNASWLQRHCNNLGITQPVNGSFLIALSYYYGETQPINGTWANAILVGCGAVPTDLIWNLTTTEWQLETSDWATAAAPSTPTFDQDGQSVNTSTPTLTGTSESLCFVILTINSQEYLTQSDGLGVWSIDVTNGLPGTPSPGTSYSVSIICKDPTTGVESLPFVGSIDVIATASTITVTMNTSWSLGWVYTWIVIEELISSGPEVWQPIEYEGNPTFDNFNKFYKQDAGPYGATPGIYGINFYSNDDGGTIVNVEREIILEPGVQYRVVGESITNGTTYGDRVSYQIDNGVIPVLPQYFPTNADFGTVAVEQQTFQI